MTAGNIAAVVGLKSATTGDTIMHHQTAKDKSVELPGESACTAAPATRLMSLHAGVPTPQAVFSAAVETEAAGQQDALAAALQVRRRWRRAQPKSCAVVDMQRRRS